MLMKADNMLMKADSMLIKRLGCAAPLEALEGPHPSMIKLDCTYYSHLVLVISFLMVFSFPCSCSNGM